MNSVLNPEAPEFYPHLTSVTQGGYTSINKTIRSSNNFPSGTSLELFKTFTDFNFVTCKLSESVVVQSNEIIITELPAVKLKFNDNDYNTEKIVDANDSMLDRININIDSICKVNKSSDQLVDVIENGFKVSSWNKTPVIAKIQVGSAMFIGAKNIPRPQLTFKDTIDNSESLWVPKISDKPNNIKPLALNILYNEEGEAVGYEHPYKVELELYHPPSSFIDPDPEPPSFPPPLEKTKLTYIDTESQVDALVKHLNDVKELAVDVEHHSYRTYQGITCLIQISTSEGDFIIDALAVREHIHKLNLSFTDPKKVKVFHGAEMDVLWLQRDFGVYIVGLFDTHQAAKVLKISGLSLKSLLMRYCQVDADKRYQLADWRIRPLPDELVKYARMDTHYLLYIWRRMKNELLEAASGQPHLLLSVFEQSRQICGVTYNKEVVHDNSHLGLYVRSKKSFNSRQMAALKLLYKWRDSQARVLDESTTYLLPNHMLLSLAEALPREVQGVNACCSPMPPFVKQNLIAIHRMLLSCRELPMEPQLFQMPQSISSMVNVAHHPLISYNVHDLTHYPEFSEDQPINLDQAAECIENYIDFQPDINAFKPTSDSETGNIVSNLNVDAKLFIPPFDRYRKYRTLAQMEELKEFKDKEAKIAAIGKGNELIKKEVLIKLQEAKALVEAEEKSETDKPDAATEVDNDENVIQKTVQRKRKISSDKRERKDSVAEATKEDKTENKPKNNQQNKMKNKSEIKSNVTRFNYKNVNYKKFYNENEKVLKQPKMKFKKHK
ncbi:unnamed protein product [Parnassius mnemosyne]|uniref:Exosome complex component 10 homolog n=1 Tax=Parnassius mnemosyne TaxID=213953 RepID=A0AAV1L0L2_9NEOP